MPSNEPRTPATVAVHAQCIAALLGPLAPLQEVGNLAADSGLIAQRLTNSISRSAIPGWQPAGNLLQQIGALLETCLPIQADLGLRLLASLSERCLDYSAAGLTYRLDHDQRAHIRRRLPFAIIASLRIALDANAANTSFDNESLYCRPDDDPELSGLLNSGLVDGHVHIGGALAYETLFGLAMRGSGNVDRTVRPSPMISTDDRAFSFDVLLVAARAITQLLIAYTDDTSHDNLIDFVRAHTELTEDFRNLLMTNEYWPKCMRSSDQVIAGDSVEWPLTMSQFFVERKSQDKTLHAPTSLFNHPIGSWFNITFGRLFRHYLHNPTDIFFSTQLTQIIRCFVVVYQAITPSSLGGLDAFTMHFAQSGKMRDDSHVAIGELVSHALTYLNQSSRLTRVELRTSIQKKSVTENSNVSMLSGTLVQYLDAYKQYLHNGGTVRTSVPITFVRRPDGTEHPIALAAHERECRFQFGHIWSAMDHLASVFIECPAAMDFFGTIDVAGNERLLANWIFALGVNELGRRLRPRFAGVPVNRKIELTFHAGEYYVHPLQGLRRIHEVLEHVDDLRRIGHGLALGIESWPTDASEERSELLDDLVWAASFADGNLRGAIVDQCRTLAKRVFGGSYDLDALREAYAARFDVNRAIEAGILK